MDLELDEENFLRFWNVLLTDECYYFVKFWDTISFH